MNQEDADALRAARGSHTGEPDYDPYADLNKDGDTSIFDAYLLNENWGNDHRGSGDDGPAAVPEPGAGTLVALAAMACMGYRRVRRRQGK